MCALNLNLRNVDGSPSMRADKCASHKMGDTSFTGKKSAGQGLQYGFMSGQTMDTAGGDSHKVDQSPLTIKGLGKNVNLRAENHNHFTCLPGLA